MFEMGFLRDKISHFMQGRYGVDVLSKTLVIGAFICAFLSFVFGKVFYVLGLVIIVYVYYRMFSKNYERRYRENRSFVDFKNKVGAYFRSQKNMMKQRKTHHIYSCPQCNQKIRIPKGRGKIIVTCPKCKLEFQKRS